MKGLREVLLVVEFGRVGNFKGALGWLDVPAWRGDLFWLTEMAGVRLGEERVRVWRCDAGKGRVDKVIVRCVILTRGGEQA